MCLELKLTCECGAWSFLTTDSIAAVARSVTQMMEVHGHFGDVYALRCQCCGREFRGGPRIFPGNPHRGALEAARWLLEHNHRYPARVQ